jgi:hypothetical protein
MKLVNIIAVAAALGLLPCAVQADEAPDLGSSAANTITHLSESVPVAVTAGLALLGEGHDDDLGRHAADSLIVTLLVVEGLKETIAASRPCNPVAMSGFPSGHTAANFAVARCIEEDYPNWGKLAYAWAGAVGWSRYRRDEHSVDQVIAGALIGTYIAERSLANHGGLLDGLVVSSSRQGFAPSLNVGALGPQMQLCDIMRHRAGQRGHPRGEKRRRRVAEQPAADVRGGSSHRV